MKNPISLLLTLLLAVSSSSCSKPNLADIVREHVAAVNNDDIEKNLTFFTNDAIFEIGAGTRLFGKDQLRNLMESDATNKARLTILDIKVEGNTVIARLTGKNEFLGLLGVEESPQRCTYKFRGRFLEKITVEFPEGGGLFDKKYRLFAEWAEREHPLEFRKMEAGGYTAESTRLLLALAKEWRDQTSTETASVEQELITLEKRWNDSWVKRDPAFLDRILADDYIETDPDDDMATKAEELALVRSTETTITAVMADDFMVRVYGDAAVVTFRLTFKKPVDGKEMTGQERFTDTWIKRDGRWQCVAVHYSRIAQK
jgi:ketosteroid isomerase-like protein